MAANDENLTKKLEIPTPDRNEDISHSKLLDLKTRQPPKTGAAVLEKDGSAHPEDREVATDSLNTNAKEEKRSHSQLKSPKDNPERPKMTPPTVRMINPETGPSQTRSQNPIPLKSSIKATSSPTGNCEARNSYAGALINQMETNYVLPCKCNPINPTKAISIPISKANTYHQAAKTLLPHGQVEAITLDPVTQLHTAIFNCGCQATKAITNLKLVSEPFIPPPDFKSEYNPRNFLKNLSKQKQLTRTKSPTPSAPSFPRFFCIIPKDNPSTIDILAFLSREIGHLQPNSITRVKNHFTLRVEKDSQSLMITKIDLSSSKSIKQIYPHLELNTSKAVCYNRELHHTTEETIKSYTSPQVLEIHQIKGTNNITIITFPTPQPPNKIEILGITFNLEPYREKPKQCKKCFSYMHKSSDCKKEPRCNKCSLPSNTHPNEECNKDPFCYLCRGNHPPISRTCPVYISEEDLLNEALKRGCGRGHIRAEKRRAANLEKEKEKEPRTNSPPKQDRMEERSEEIPPQSETWTEKQTRRKRRYQTNKQSMTSIPDLPTFELPSIYRNDQRKETPNLSSNVEDGLKPPTQQKTIPETLNLTNLCDYPRNPDEENMEVTLEEERQPKDDNLSQKPNPLKTKIHSPCTSTTKEPHLKNIKKNKLPIQERKTEKVTTPPLLQSPITENPMGVYTGEDQSLPDTFASPLQPKTPTTITQQAHIQTTTDNSSPKIGASKRHPSDENEYEQPKPNIDSSPTASSQEPPKKRGKQGSPNSQGNNNSEKTLTPTIKTGSKKSKRCNICKTNYKTITCYKEHQAYFHPYPSYKPNAEKIPNHDATRIPKDHKCSDVPHERCLTLYKIYRGSPSEENSHLVDNRESIYESISHFRRGIKRSSTALKQSNREKIYGPQTTDNLSKHENTENNRKEQLNITNKHKSLSAEHPRTSTTNPEKSQSLEVQKPPSETSQVLENQRLEKSTYSGNIVKNVVAQLEVSRKTHLQHNPLQSTWPNQLGHMKYKIQYSPSIRDPRLRSYSDLYKLETVNTQSQYPKMKSSELPENIQPKVKQDSQQLQRTLSLNSLPDSTVHHIQTLISTRNDKSVSHNVQHNLK